MKQALHDYRDETPSICRYYPLQCRGGPWSRTLQIDFAGTMRNQVSF
jgi:hypothetical protein